MTHIKSVKNTLLNISWITLFFDDELNKLSDLDKQQLSFFKKELENEREIIVLQELNIYHYYIPVKKEDTNPELIEKLRSKGHQILLSLNSSKASDVCLSNEKSEPEFVLAVAEGMALGNYQFLKYL